MVYQSLEPDAEGGWQRIIMDRKSVKFNAELASHIGILHIEALNRADIFARQILGVISRRCKVAIMPGNLSSRSAVESNLFGVFHDINEFVLKRCESILAISSREMVDKLSDMLDNFSMMESKKTINKTIFPGVPRSEIRRIILSQNIPQRILKRMQKTGKSPTMISNLVTITTDPIKRAAILSQYFASMRNEAYKISRTSVSGMVAKTTRKAFDSLPTDLIGFQVHGIMDNRIRPAHKERNGTIYYKKPRYENPGFDEMPNPPYEADGSIAWNCRCWLTPVMKLDAKKFFDFKGRIIPDAKIFNSWFRNTTKAKQLLAVGVKRYQLASKRLGKGEKLEWYHLLNPVTGMLLSQDELRDETKAERLKRIAKAKKVITRS